MEGPRSLDPDQISVANSWAMRPWVRGKHLEPQFPPVNASLLGCCEDEGDYRGCLGQGQGCGHSCGASLPESDQVGAAARPAPRPQGRATHPSVGLALPPALVPADAAVDPHHVTFPQRKLSHVSGSKVVPGHSRADDAGREHC